MRKSNSFPKTRAETGGLFHVRGLNEASMADHGVERDRTSRGPCSPSLTTSRPALPAFLIVSIRSNRSRLCAECVLPFEGAAGPILQLGSRCL